MIEAAVFGTALVASRECCRIHVARREGSSLQRLHEIHRQFIATSAEDISKGSKTVRESYPKRPKHSGYKDLFHKLPRNQISVVCKIL